MENITYMYSIYLLQDPAYIYVFFNIIIMSV